MFRSLLLAACMVVGAASQANTLSLESIAFSSAKAITAQANLTGQFEVGDTNNYTLKVMGMAGTMVMTVAEITSSTMTINQDVSIMGQAQKAVIIIDINTGEIISITVNGQKQDPPPPGDTEIVDHKSATITVPAGTFNCQYVKTHSKSQNTDADQWVDMSGTVGVGGMLKTNTKAQGYDVSIELTKYLKK